MSFLLLNDILPKSIEETVLQYKNKLEFSFGGDDCIIFYDGNDWDYPPLINKNGVVLFVAGWFIGENNKRNDIHWLLEKISDLKEISDVLDLIESGVFIAGYFKNSEWSVFTDPFALSPHFYSKKEMGIKISPSAFNISSEESFCEEKNKILISQGHLFGNLTAFSDVFRFVPGDCIIKKDEYDIITHNFGFNLKNPNEVEEVFSLAAELVNSTPVSLQSIALSAGFDSRLIFCVSDPQYAYTWGPETSLDIVNANKLAKNRRLSNETFPFRRNKVSESDLTHCEYLFKGVVKNYNPQFFANYKYVANQSKKIVWL